jgi:LysR family nitrogen assimilation transcriptional regulator
MELRQLRYFLVIARERHFGRAAQVLNVAQPALSRQIHKMEEELQVPLFVRHSRGVSLTPAAELLVQRAQHVLTDLENIGAGMATPVGPPSGTVLISMAPGLIETLAAPLAAQVTKNWPNVHLGFRTAHFQSRAKLVQDGTVDIAIVHALHSLPGVQVTPLWRDRLCLICRADDKRFTKPIVELEDIARVPLICGFQFTGPRLLLDAAMARVGLNIQPVTEVDRSQMSKQLVLAGTAPTVNTALRVRDEIERGDLRAIPIRDMHMIRAIATPADRPVGLAAATVKEEIKTCVHNLIATGEWPHAEEIDATGAPAAASKEKSPGAAPVSAALAS